MHTYAIGDIHGHLDKLNAVHDLIADDMARNGTGPVVHVGDYEDRGPDSRGVIDFLIAGQARGEDWVTLRGNHDRMFAGFLQSPEWKDEGLRADLSYLHYKIGGGETLASYGVKNAADRPLRKVHPEAVAAVPPEHRAFLAGLQNWWQRDQAIFVHAGIRPGVTMPDQTETDLIWIRKEFLEDPRDHGALIVHGHTAIDQPRHYGNRLNIDSSVAYGGPLSAVVLEGRNAYRLIKGGRLPIRPETA
jgi:serine/threonine protein phosphatase 1